MCVCGEWVGGGGACVCVCVSWWWVGERDHPWIADSKRRHCVAAPRWEGGNSCGLRCMVVEISQRQTRWDPSAKCEERREDGMEGRFCLHWHREHYGLRFFAIRARPLGIENPRQRYVATSFDNLSGPTSCEARQGHQPGSRRGGHTIVQHAVPSYPPSILSAFPGGRRQGMGGGDGPGKHLLGASATSLG